MAKKAPTIEKERKTYAAAWHRRLHWGLLRTVGNSRLVASSVVWLLVVPIAAKLLAPFAGPQVLRLPFVDPSDPIAVTVALPFSWQRFYLMSWLFIIGHLVYRFCCPEIVRKYASYGEYRRDHAGPIRLKAFLLSAVRRASPAGREEIVDLATTDIAEVTDPSGAYVRAERSLLSHNAPYSDEEPEFLKNRLFDSVLSVERHARPVWIWLSGMCFLGGFVLFGWVVLEGANEVWKLL